MRLHKIFVILVSLATIVLLQVGFVFFLIGLMPAIVAYLVDHSEQKYMYKAVLACNLAGMMPTLMEIMAVPSKSAYMQKTMGDPAVWLMVYACAAGGWALVWCCRFIAYGLIKVTHEGRIAMLEYEQKKLVEEWGDAVKGDAA